MRRESASKLKRTLAGLAEHLRQARESRDLAGKVVFSSARGRSSSFLVRGVQVAEAMGAAAIRARHLSAEKLKDAAAVVWVADPVAELAQKLKGMVPQVLDVLQLGTRPIGEQIPGFELMDGYLVNTPSMAQAVRKSLQEERPTAIIPHHHCNAEGFSMPEDRMARPKVVGYLGAGDHLDRREEIAAHVRSLGLEFREWKPYALEGYREMDLGVAWTEGKPDRVRFQSNVKHANHCAFGVPSVLRAYESYLLADDQLGGGSCLFAHSFEEFLAQLERLAMDEALRREIAGRRALAAEVFSMERIVGRYEEALARLR